MSFDVSRYEREFLRPLRGRRERLSGTDLVDRYAIPASLTLDELRAHLAEIRSYWQARAAGPDSYADLCRQLVDEDQRLREAVGDVALGDPHWWTEQARAAVPLPRIRGGAVDDSPQPERLTAVPAGATVELAWHGEPAIHRILRGARPPTSISDGVLVAETREHRVVDHDPPVGTPVHYAVYANLGEGWAWSAPATVGVTVLPPVTGVRTVRRSGRIVITWTAHPAADAVPVRRTAGSPPASATDGVVLTASLSSVEDSDVDPDTGYFYGLVAAYGAERSAMVVAAAPAGTAQSLADMHLAVTVLGTQQDVTRVRLTWLDPGGTGVRIRRGDRASRWSPGSTIQLADLDRYGVEVDGELSTQDGECVLEATVPVGYHVYVPFAVTPSGVVVGRSAAQGAAEPVSHLAARRMGDLVLVSWRWPSATGVAEASWDTPSGPASQRISRAQYDDESGLRLRFGRAAGEIRVRLLTRTAAGPTESPYATVHVGPAPPRLDYSVIQRRRTVVVELTAGEDCEVTLTVVAASEALPSSPEQGTVVATHPRLTLPAGTPRTIDVTLPATLHRPLWIRCFIDPPWPLIGPPITTLRIT